MCEIGSLKSELKLLVVDNTTKSTRKCDEEAL